MKLTSSAAIALSLSAGIALADPAGFSTLTFDAPHHGRDINGSIWYPTSAEGPGEIVAENAVFVGVEALKDSPVQEGTHPVVLLSHGLGGEVRSIAWLASDLAEQGMIVISVSHPNSTWSDFDLKEGLKHWTRPQDLSLALDVISEDPRFKAHLDTSRVMAAGFSYGGWTSLSLGGLRGSHAGYVAHCAEHGAASSHCADMMRAGISLDDVDATLWDKSYADDRVTHVAAIDPGLMWGLTDDHAKDLVENVRLIGFGEGEDRMLGTDFDFAGLPALLPEAKVNRFVPAVHFTGMPLCKPMGAAILEEEKDDPVCTDPEGADREQVHKRIVQMILSDLGQPSVLSQ